MKSQALAIGLIASVGVHAAVFTAVPAFSVGSWDGTVREVRAVELPPEVHVPPPPQAIPRPATPRVSSAPDISEDVTIAPTDFAHNPVSSLAPPPRQHDSGEDGRPAFVAYEVAPKLRNGPRVQALLQRRYPRELRNAGIEGTVVVWIHLTEVGRPDRARVRASSGYPALDEVARHVALEMVFSPALNRDRPVAVWVAQSVQFDVR